MKWRLNSVRTLGLLIVAYSVATLSFGTVSFSLWQRHERWLQDEPKRTEAYRLGQQRLTQALDLEALRREALHLLQDRERVRQVNHSIGDDLRVAAYANLVVLAGTTVLLAIALSLLRKERRGSDHSASLEPPRKGGTSGAGGLAAG